MRDMFENLRAATRACIEQLGGTRDEELFEFRNAATFTVVHNLVREYDRLCEEVAAPVALHSLGTLTAAEVALLQAFREADDRSKTTIQIAAVVASEVAEEFALKERCEVVNIASARPRED